MNWTLVLADLDARRSAALAAADVDGLEAIYTARSPLLAKDLAVLAALGREGAGVAGSRHVITAVSVVRTKVHRADRVGITDTGSTGEPADEVTLRVVESLPSVDVYGPGGKVIGHTRASRSSTRLIRLAAAADGYRIAEVTVVG